MSVCRQTLLLFHRCAAHSLSKPNITHIRCIKRWVSPTLKELYRRREKLGPQPEKPRSTYLEWNYEAEIYAFGKRLGEEFDKKILKQALRQREYTNLQEFQAKDRGEVLVDNSHNYDMAIEGEQIISNYIKTAYSKLYPPEIVEAVHSYLTSVDMLSNIGTHIGLKDIVYSNEFPVEKRTLSNSFKAIVSALKRSTSLERAENFVRDFVLTQMNGKDVYEIWDPKEPYQYLREILNKKGVSDLEPRLCNQSAANTILACFQVGLYSKKKLLGIGWGESIEVAKETAALDAVRRLHESERKVNVSL